MSQQKNNTKLHVAAIGGQDFCRRTKAMLAKQNAVVLTGNLSEAWSLVLEYKPQVVILEIGLHHSDRGHVHMRRFLTQVRERFQQEIYIAIALLSPQHLTYGGDLLFSDEESLDPSGFVDTFLAVGPGSVPSIPPLSEQLRNLLDLFELEHSRRVSGQVPLPPLLSDGWVQSLADPKSRELWMRWLPRYSTYTNENPIIIGETGTGKTKLARALHHLSNVKGKFVGITPRDFSSSELIQAELFGAVAGAYTGAIDKWGLVKSAEHGTLFFDELQSIDKDLQGKLITFIENKSYRRVGSAEMIKTDVRFVFASNRSLPEMIENDVLRDDFAYRLERVLLELKPLRERKLDIPAALAYALAKIPRQRPYHLPVMGLTNDAYRMLFTYPWPGNLRQLENSTAKLCEVADMNNSGLIDKDTVLTIFKSNLAESVLTPAELVSQAAERLSRSAIQRSVDSLEKGLEEFTEVLRYSALEATGGNISLAADLLGESERLLEIFSETDEVKQELEAQK